MGASTMVSLKFGVVAVLALCALASADQVDTRNSVAGIVAESDFVEDSFNSFSSKKADEDPNDVVAEFLEQKINKAILSARSKARPQEEQLTEVQTSTGYGSSHGSGHGSGTGDFSSHHGPHHGHCAPYLGQCGGFGFAGPFCCNAPYTCEDPGDEHMQYGIKQCL